MLTFILGFLLGGMFGVFTIAMTVSAKQADEAMQKLHDKK
jgi:LPS O-antigen subunit length determinant protein (WzzB/FepE family)